MAQEAYKTYAKPIHPISANSAFVATTPTELMSGSMPAVANAATSARKELLPCAPALSARTKKREDDNDTEDSRASRHGLGAAVVQDIDEVRRGRRQHDEQLRAQNVFRGGRLGSQGPAI